jgi:SOS-response transcriptional repressor LexA
MADRLKNGWKVLVDTTRTTPTEGDLVAVYIYDEGSVLGFWHRDGDEVSIRKANPDFKDIRLDPNGQWVIWGIVTTIVEAPA